MPLNIASEENDTDVGEDIPTEEVVEEANEPEIMVEENNYGEIDEIIKAVSDINTTPTDGMVTEAKKGIEWRKEFNRGGTRIGATRASQIVAKERLSPSTVKKNV